MEGLASAIRIMKESHADALKLEGGEEIIGTVKHEITSSSTVPSEAAGASIPSRRQSVGATAVISTGRSICRGRMPAP